MATKKGNAQISSPMETKERSLTSSEISVIVSMLSIFPTVEGMVSKLVWKVLNLCEAR